MELPTVLAAIVESAAPRGVAVTVVVSWLCRRTVPVARVVPPGRVGAPTANRMRMTPVLTGSPATRTWWAESVTVTPSRTVRLVVSSNARGGWPAVRIVICPSG